LKTLIIEFFATGHYPEYLKHVLRELNHSGRHSEYVVYLSERIRKRVVSFEHTPVYKSIFFFSEEVSEAYSKFESTRLMSDFIYHQIFEIQQKHQFNHVLFLNLNFFLLQRSAINPFKKLPFTFSGIFFNSPYRSRQAGEEKLGVWKKELVLRLLSLNKNCKGVFLLNDKAGAAYYGRWSSKIKFIVDPVSEAKASDLNIHKFHQIAPSAVSFAHLGYLGRYKGTFEVIDAIHNIQSSSEDLNAVFLFIGKMLKDLKADFKDLTMGLNADTLKVREGFISDANFMAYIKQTDVVLIANRNVLATSGIVNHCMANNKVVIAPNKGYFKEAFSNYKGAVLYDEHFDLQEAIRYTIQHVNQLQQYASKFNSTTFIQQNSGKVFANTLMR